MVKEGDLALGGQHAMQYTYNILNYALETCILLFSVTLINLI